MAKSVRVYELARQLGMTNADVIELCGSLGVDVKSHSSGMVEAQADRVRRKAIREGLASEPKEEKTPAKQKKTKSTTAKKTVSETSEKEDKNKEKADEVSSEKTETVDEKKEETKKETSASRVISSSGSSPVPQIDEEDEKTDQSESSELLKENHDKVEAKGKEETKTKKQKGPVSPSGKKIPPPPGSPKSLSGKPIPPPPGAAKSKPKSKPDGGGPAPGRRSTPPPTSDTKRPSSRGEAHKPSSGSGPRQDDPRSSAPPSAGKPGEQKRGPGSGARRRPKKKGRKRRTTEELQPMDAAPLALTPEDVAVPEGVVLLERQSTAQEIAPKLNRTSADVID